MPITFPCDCGQPLVVEDRYAGAAVRCPECGGAPVAPGGPAAKPWRKGAAAPAPAGDPADPFGFTSPADAARERERRLKEGEREAPAEAGSAAGAAGGVLMMVGAVVWFVVGLANDTLFFYPPVLFVIGLVAFVKGLSGGRA
jgi:hypothetical protein